MTHTCEINDFSGWIWIVFTQRFSTTEHVWAAICTQLQAIDIRKLDTYRLKGLRPTRRSSIWDMWEMNNWELSQITSMLTNTQISTNKHKQKQNRWKLAFPVFLYCRCFGIASATFSFLEYFPRCHDFLPCLSCCWISRRWHQRTTPYN